MAKIENEAETKPTATRAARRRYAVVVSFNGLGEGDTFDAGDGPGDTAWEEYFVGVGYLRPVSEGGPDVPGADHQS